MYSPHARYFSNPEAVMRPLPEWHACFVYTPASPQVIELNATAWLITELCDGGTGAEIADAFKQFVAKQVQADEAERLFADGIEKLIANGVVVTPREEASHRAGST